MAFHYLFSFFITCSDSPITKSKSKERIITNLVLGGIGHGTEAGDFLYLKGREGSHFGGVWAVLASTLLNSILSMVFRFYKKLAQYWGGGGVNGGAVSTALNFKSQISFS